MANERTTMSVPEMQRMLGIKKTDAYWLVHKNVFETIIVEKKMRVVIASFEKWYANQVKHSKVDGPPPGAELKAYSYSVQEMANLLGVSDDVVYAIIKRDHLETFEVDYWKRIRKDVFETWYKGQTKYRTAEDRERDKAQEEMGYTMPEIAKMLLISRKEVYNLLASPKCAGVFEYFTVAEKKRITKESFETWYRGQCKYIKFEDRSPEEQERIRMLQKQEKRPSLMVDPNKQAYDIKETAVLLDVPVHEIRRMISEEELEAKKFGNRYLILKSEIEWWLLQQKMDVEN